MAILAFMRHRFYKNDGTVNAGGKVWTYVAGTTTPTTTFTDNVGSVPNTNPIILDSKGEAGIWSNGVIKVNVLEADDTQVTGWPVDYIGTAPSIGALNYRGTWNASTNTPTLTSSAGTKGYTYIVSVAGTTSLDGLAVWNVDDFAIFNGTVWQRVEGGASSASSATASASAALASQVAAAASASASAASAVNSAASAVDAANGAVVWVSGTTYSTGNVRYSPLNYQNYRRITNGAGTTDPSADSTNWVIQAVPLTWTIKTTTYTAVANDRIMANTSGGAFTITLPASPAANDWVQIADYSGTFATNNLTVGRNAKNIMGLAENLALNLNNASIRLEYIDATQGWRIV